MNKVQVLMATFNGEKYIDKQIQSIINQTYDNWELLIRDDGSTDNTKKILKEYKFKYPNKIFLLETDSNDNLGAGQNFIRLLNLSESNYIMFSDQDDIWIKNKIEIFIKAMINYEKKYHENTPIIIHSDLKVINEKENIIHDSFHKLAKTPPEKFRSLNKLLVKCFPGCSTMINKPLKNISLLHSTNELELHDLWLFLIASIFGKVFYLKEPTMMYRLHSNNTVGLGSKNGDYEKNIFKIIKNFNQKKINFYQDENMRHKYAYLILRDYFYLLGEYDKEILTAFNNIMTKSFLKKKYYIIKYNFLEENILMNLRRLIYY